MVKRGYMLESIYAPETKKEILFFYTELSRASRERDKLILGIEYVFKYSP